MAAAANPLSIVYSFPDALGRPGIGWTAWNQVTELIALGHRVHVVAASLALPVPGAASMRLTLTVGGRRVPHRAVGWLRAMAWHDRVASTVVRARVPDVVHGWPLGSRQTFAVARSVGSVSCREAPNTHTAHAYEVVAEECARLGIVPPKDASHTHNAERLAIEEAEWAAADAILAPSAVVRESFIRKGFDPDRVVRHQYGFRRRAGFNPRPRQANGRPLTALYLGRVEPRKGLHYGLRAWIASDASATGRFIVCGDMVPGYRAVLGPMLAHRSVEVRGFTDDPAGALAGADVLVLPTIEEGSALVTYEAQAAGCVPLVSTAAGALAEDGVQALMHEPRDQNLLSAQFSLLATDRVLLARLSLAGIAHGPELGWDAAAQALVTAYRSAVDRSTH